jgi:hypothetical protein
VAFATCAHFARFLDYLTDKTGIHPNQFVFRGSTKIGFSISPNREKKKTWQRLGPTSDLDLAIVDPHFYETLDEQVRRYEVEGLVHKYESWEFLGLVRDAEGVCRGIVALDWYSMKIEAFPASAVMLATGGPGIVFGRSTNSVINT